MKLYIRHTDKSQTIMNVSGLEDAGQYIKAFNENGYRKIAKFPAIHEDFDYTPGIESYQLDGFPAVWVRQDEHKSDY